MALHLLKLCVGVDTLGELDAWIAEQMALLTRLGRPPEQTHTTRMVPKRLDDLIGEGSLYWVIKGQISARQRLTDIRPFTDADGIGRCRLVLEPVLIPVTPRPCRPFQGWRYLAAGDAPPDLASGGGDLGAMPEAMRRELAEMGLL
jgi:hypothetical protein